MNIENNQELFNIINKGIVIYETIDGVNFIFKNINRHAEKIDKLKREDVIGKNLLDVFPNALDFGFLDILRSVYKTGESQVLPVKFYNDKRISGWRENNIYKLSTGEVIVVYDDLTEFKQVEEALLESEYQFRSFFENNKAVILKVDTTTRKIINCNKAAISYYGYTKKELLNKTIEELNILPLDEIKIKIQEAIKKESNFFEFKHRLSSGEIRDVELYASPINIKGKIHLFVIIHDITDRIKSQKAHIENQRLSAIGEMASSIAHDFNNSLQSISGNIELCSYETPDINPNLKNKLKEIQSSIKDTASRVKSLLKFSGYKDNNSTQEVINLSVIVDDVIFQAKPLWKSELEKDGLKINIIRNFNKDLSIKGNKGVLVSAFFNILKNAIEAMPKGGNITFTIKKVNDKVQLLIKDTGVGMDEDTKIRLFQPFFSTKGLELGRGLGMSGVHTVISDYDGEVSVKDTKLGKGTTIELLFPYLSNIQKTELEKFKENSLHLKKNDTKILNILWVDDDDAIISIVKRYIDVLGHIGYVSISAINAIKLLEKNTYDVLITDIGMPEMNGWQLVDKVRTELKNNDIKIFLLSGWQIEEDKLIKKYNISKVLQKPITINELRESLSLV